MIQTKALLLTVLTTVLSPVLLGAQTTDTVLVDDFAPQPLKGQSLWYYNRTGGDRGVIGDPASVTWNKGSVRVSIPQGQTYAGTWTAFNHAVKENIPLDFSAIFPSQILPPYQGRVTQLRVHVLGGRGTFQVEYQAPNLSFLGRDTRSLTGGAQTIVFTLPALGKVRNVNLLVVGQAQDFVVMDRVELVVDLPALPSMSTAQRAFLWSYAMLLSNWSPATGLTRDRSNFPAGDFDNVSASGLQAAAAAQAWRLGYISGDSAVAIVEKTTAGLLALSTFKGIWPHFVKNGQIVPDTEWSSLDGGSALISLMEVRQALGLSTTRVESALKGVDWAGLILPDSTLSHGYQQNGQRIVYGWKDFGCESWLANLAYAAATGRMAVMDRVPPTYNGGGFVDELAWLLSPPFPSGCRDAYGIDWGSYRQTAVDAQLAYYRNDPRYGPANLFGLSAAEVPDPSLVDASAIYQPFGVGGKSPANDGKALLGSTVIAPHYSGMVSALRPGQAAGVWSWMEEKGLFTPLNNVESFTVVSGSSGDQVVWNALKGSWNLGLQTLGWGGRLTGNDNPLYQGLMANVPLRKGLDVIAPPVILASVASLEFPGTNVGASSQKMFAISNTGGDSLKVSIASSDGQFAASPATATLPAGGRQTITVTFAPTTSRVRAATLTISNSDPAVATRTVNLVASIPTTGLASDFNGDGKVDLDDFFSFAEGFGKKRGGTGFGAKFDLNGNGTVDLDDFFLFAADFGKATK